jgi:hypothetical protein
VGSAGYLALAGGMTDQYVDLPNGTLSGLGDATFEIWFTWAGGNAWQRLFDFGSSDAAEGTQGQGLTYLFLTCAPTPRVGFRAAGQSEVSVAAADATDPTLLNHVTVVFHDTADTLLLYVAGVAAGSVATTHSLSEISTLNSWLGRSQFVNDADFGGALGEFRIYDVAMTAEQVALSAQLGANPVFLE